MTRKIGSELWWNETDFETGFSKTQDVNTENVQQKDIFKSTYDRW